MMCGIIGYIGSKSVVPVVLEGLKKLEYRGYDSAGIAVVDGNRIERRRVKGKIAGLEQNLKKDALNGSYGIGHTRWATHGRPSEENAHPHQDCKEEFVIVHNGIIENYLDIKEKLRKKGHDFQTETDTEVIVHLIEEVYKDSLEQAVRDCLQKLEGAYAFVVISTRDPNKIVVAKEKSPAVLGLGEEEYFVSSDINSFLEHTQNVVFLDDKEMAVVTEQGVEFTDFKGNPLKKNIEKIAWNPLMIEKRGFKHFMMKEIFEQPQGVRDTLENRMSLESGKVFLDEISLSESVLADISRIVIVACGTSYHAGLIGKHFIETLAKVPVDVEYASEFRYKDILLEKNSLLVFISQSGETLDSLSALKEIKKNGYASLAICNVFKSSIVREADGVLYTHAGPEIGVAATKTFTAQMAALALLALYLAQVRKQISLEESIPYIQDLQRIPHNMEEILDNTDSLKDFSEGFISYSHFLYLGRWVSSPAAMEGALKLKEISYIHAEAYPGGEMKHGPIALIDKKMPTMAVIPRDRVYDKMLSNISEVKTRNGYVIAVADKEDQDIQNRVDKVIRIPSVNPLFSPFLSAIPLQLFAYYIANARGADVDQPRNLAKSVTVE